MASDTEHRAQTDLIAAQRGDGRAIALAVGRVLGQFEADWGPPLAFNRTPARVMAFRVGLRTMVGANDLRQFPPKAGVLPADTAKRRENLRRQLHALFGMLVASAACPPRCREGYGMAVAALDELEAQP